MSVTPTTLSVQQQRAVDDAVLAYVAWRAECTAVWDSYHRWASAPSADTDLAHRAYAAAIDREEAAANRYGELMRDVGHLMETGLDDRSDR
jgi:hypothetical protein